MTITFAAPGFVLAGAAAALVPLALHLIRRRPPVRAPLPTERFLTPDPRTAVRVGRPTDLPLLALRMLLLVLAGAAFSRPAWHPARRGTADVVLLDRAAQSSADTWRRALAEARARLLRPPGGATGALVLFADSARVVPRTRVTPALFDSLAATTGGPAFTSYAAALRAIPAAVRGLEDADSVRVALITPPRWAGWRDAVAALRRATWPGAIDVVPVPLPLPPDTNGVRGARTAVYLARDPARAAYARTALEAYGWTVRFVAPAAGRALPDATLYLAAQPVPPALAPQLASRARAGAAVLVAAPAADSLRPLLSPLLDVPYPGGGGALWLDDRTRVAGVRRTPSAEPEELVPFAVWEDGRWAAGSLAAGRGCIVFAAFDVEQGEMTLDPGYPHLLDVLGRGCEARRTAAAADGPLDAGALAVLRGSGPRVVPAAEVPGAREGVPLGRWLMALALAAALAETFLAYGRKGGA